MNSLSTPGSVVILGEYAILERGLGVACATAPRMYLHFEASDRFSVRGMRTSELVTVDAELCAICLSELGLAESELHMSLTADGRGFFHSSGRKKGLGSSAALVVALIAGCMVAAGEDPLADRDRVFHHALRAHRKWKRGGSGYDVAVSSYGGCGLFRGGVLPEWDPVSLPWKLELEYTAQSMDTTQAVQRFLSWQASHPRAAAEFLAASDHYVQEFLATSQYSLLQELMAGARQLYDGLEKRIGIRYPDNIRLPSSDVAWKTSGAGYELLLYLHPPPDEMMTEEGLRWE